MKSRWCALWIVSFVLAAFFTSTAFAQSKTWTADADFDSGVLNNVVHTPANQLDLGPTAVSQAHTVWATNYLYGYVVRMDTLTGKQTARYDSALQIVEGLPSGARPPREYCDFGSNGNCPGRVAVDTSGDVWIVNRAFGHQGTLTRIAGDITRCVDRNGNSAIETSVDTNNDGVIDVTSPTEFLGQNDECVLTTFPLGVNNTYARSVAIDKNGKIWGGTFTDGKIYRFNPNPPYALEATVTVGGNPYSMAAGGDYILVSNAAASGTKRVHISTLAVESVACPATYGLVATPAGDAAWLGGYFSGSNIYKADFTTSTCTTIPTSGQVTAMTLDLAGNVWAASYTTHVLFKYSSAGVLIGSYPAGGTNPHGLAVDFQGNIWTVLHGPASLSKISSATGALVGTYSIAGPGIPNADPYLYGDYTGAQLDRQAPYTRAGSWDGIFDGQLAGLSWSTVRWNTEPQGAEPAGTLVVVGVRAADTLPALSSASYTPTGNGAPLVGIAGRYVQVRSDLTSPGWATPSLSDITVEGPCAIPGESCCLSDGDCDDLNVCTSDSCPALGGVCAHVNNPDCCTTDAQCAALTDDCNVGACDQTSNTCQAQPANQGGACDDADACTVGTTCDAGGQCVGGGAVDCNDGDPCTRDSCLGGCINNAAPAATCLDAPKTSLLVKYGASDAKDLIKWKWGSGAEIIQANLADPKNSTTYTLCVYDSTGGIDFRVAALRIDPNAAWIDKTPKGWKYTDKAGSEDGVIKARLKPGVQGKSWAGVSAKGANIPMPTPLSGTEMFDLDGRVTVQLFNDATSTCWNSQFTTARKNTQVMFQAKTQ